MDFLIFRYKGDCNEKKIATKKQSVQDAAAARVWIKWSCLIVVAK